MTKTHPDEVDNVDSPEHSAGLRMGRALLTATMPFAVELSAKSWRQVGLTFTLLIAALSGSALIPWWPLRVLLSVLGALLIVRAFITYHDYRHGTILRDSSLAWMVFHLYGIFGLAPPNSWKKSHTYYHGHVGQISKTGIGAFPVMTAKMWRDASASERLWYRIQRHPLTVILGYVTVFALNICLLPLLCDPYRHWDSAVSLLAHGGLIAVLWMSGGFQLAFFVVLLPMTLASALGSYLFFAQHSYKRMKIISPKAWSHYRGGNGIIELSKA